MSQVEIIIDKQLKEFREKFKPIFGLQSHIEVVEAIAKLTRLEKELEKTNAEAAKAKRLKEEVMLAKRNLLFNFKNL